MASKAAPRAASDSASQRASGRVKGSGGEAVQVAVRVRPLSADEAAQGSESCVDVVGKSVLLAEKQFDFDAAFSTTTQQESVFASLVSPMIDQFFDGYNATVLAYGQTGSGKTYTMGNDLAARATPSERGVIPRVIENVFERVQASENPDHFMIKLSYLEILNEEVYDLLVKSFPTATSSGLVVRGDGDRGIVVSGLSEHVVKSSSMAQDLLRSGALARSTASTSMNAHSSRSHAICTLTMEHHEIAVAEGGTETRFSKFHLVDLAGSERVRRTNSEGARFKEGVNINRGLLALGNVINALWERKQTKPMTAHVPYRDSKLTRLLQDSLGGNSKTLMIACISTSDVNYEETSNTLRYASRTRNIENVAVVNKERSAENEVAHLKQQLEIVQLQLLQQKHGMVKGPLRIEAQNSSVCEENTVLSGGALEEENRNLKQELLAANAATDKWKKIAGDLMDKSKMESQPSQLRTPTPKKLNVASGQREQGSKSGPPCRLEQLRHFQSQKGKALLRKEGADAKRKAEDVALIASKRNRTLASPIPNTSDAIRTSVMGRKKKVPPAPITRSKVGEPISSEVTKLVQQLIASQEATISAKEAVRVNLADRKVLAHTITQLEALSTAENTETLAKLQNDLRSKTANIRLLQQKLARIEKTTSLPSGLFPSKLETCHELIRYLVEILIECKEECLDFSNCRADLSEAKDKIVTIQETHRKKMHRMETKLEVTKKELEALQMQASKKNTDKKRKARESYETMETLFSSSDEEEDNSEADSDYVDEDDQRKGRKCSSKKKSLKIARNVDIMDEIDELLETSTATCCSCHGMCATKACACKSQNRDCSSQCSCNSTKCRNRECSDAPGTSDDTRLSDESIEDIDQTSPSTPQRGDATAVSSSATDESNLMVQEGAARVIDFMSP